MNFTSMNFDLQKIWQAVLAELELSIPKANFKTWFQNTFLLRIEDETAIISVPNIFTKNWLEKKYYKNIVESLGVATEEKIKKAKFEVGSGLPVEVMPEKLKVVLPQVNSHGLNPNYTFKRFIAGKENELAYAAAGAVAKNPGKKYNPLFIYGGVGLGKTHLLHAIGHEILEKNKKLKVICTNAEKFTNEYVEALKSNSMEKFREKQYGADVFLVDDIQFMAGRKGTQEIFFHIFNHLHQMEKQIVIASDRPPKALPALEDRLISRFNWGLIADVIPPGLEMRMAILKAKAGEMKIHLSDEVFDYLANQITSNVRELEGVLNRLLAYKDFHKVEITLDVAKSIVNSLVTGVNKKFVQLKEVLETVSDFYNIKVSEIIGQSRKKELVEPRQVAMYLLREELKYSFPLIGREFGNRDHTTVMYACEKVKKELAEEGRRKQEVDFIKEKLYKIK